MISEHDTRRLNLAEWYAREAIGYEAVGLSAAAEEALETAGEYLSVLYGRTIRPDTAADVIALVCQYREAPQIDSGEFSGLDLGRAI